MSAYSEQLVIMNWVKRIIFSVVWVDIWLNWDIQNWSNTYEKQVSLTYIMNSYDFYIARIDLEEKWHHTLEIIFLGWTAEGKPPKKIRTLKGRKTVNFENF